MTLDELARTRRSWHGLAELVLAGPQYRASGTIRLRITPGGFATIKEPDLRVDGDDLVAGDQRLPMAGRSYADVARAAGVDPGRPEGLYSDGAGVAPDGVIEVSLTAARLLAHAFARGDEALRAFAPDETPVLWPEHFDLGITVDEVNYGVSPGDSYLGEPYAYVGPWKQRTGPFWNAPFGATRPMRELPGVDELVAFFAEGRRQAAGSR